MAEATALPRHTNNLDALRLLGALMVIVGHAYSLLGRTVVEPGLLGYSISTFGVVIFFSISGYLITASWERQRAVVPYLAARVLRIFPALIVVVVASVLLLGPVVTTLSLHDYLHNPSTRSYLIDNLLLRPQYALPGVWDGLPWPNAVNGSLWTLPVEFFCYLLVPVLLCWRRSVGFVAIAGCLALALWASAGQAAGSLVVWGTGIGSAASVACFFAGGALVRLAHQRWRGLLRTDVAVALFCLQLVIVGWKPVAAPWTAWATLPYPILVVGLASTPYLRRASRFGDLSYGLYVWAFPIQQLVVAKFGVLSMWVNLPLVTLVTLGLAFCSWHLIERPAMSLRERLRSTSARKPSPRVLAAQESS